MTTHTETAVAPNSGTPSAGTYARQAIVTTYISPTNYRGSRVKARCQRGSITLGWDNALNAEQNHWRAAQALCDRFCAEDAKDGRYSTPEAQNPWNHPRVMGALPAGGYCHIFAKLKP